MTKRKGVKKRYLITVSSIILAIVSVLILRSFDTDFERRQVMLTKEIRAIMEFNKDIFHTAISQNPKEKAKTLRDEFANKISYKKLLDKNDNFKNFKYLPSKDIYGIKLINNAHIGFFHNSDDCGNMDEKKDYCAGIIIDINGYTRPNRFGQDQFFFKVYKNGITE